jgi:hypothetical protein
MSEIRQSEAVLWCNYVALRSPSFEARGSHAANIQADADLYTFSSHHRDAMPEMRRADAAGFDRATRPALQSPDLSLRALRLRRELFESDVAWRQAAPKRYQPVKALLARLAGKALGRKGHWLAIYADAGWKIPAPETCDTISNAATTARRLISRKN